MIRIVITETVLVTVVAVVIGFYSLGSLTASPCQASVERLPVGGLVPRLPPMAAGHHSCKPLEPREGEPRQPNKAYSGLLGSIVRAY